MSLRGACRGHGATDWRCRARAPGPAITVVPSFSTTVALANCRHGISGHREPRPATKHVTPRSGFANCRGAGSAGTRGALGCPNRNLEISPCRIFRSFGVITTRATNPGRDATPDPAALELRVTTTTATAATPTTASKTTRSRFIPPLRRGRAFVTRLRRAALPELARNRRAHALEELGDLEIVADGQGPFAGREALGRAVGAGERVGVA
jgi:hypothetical protein